MRYLRAFKFELTPNGEQTRKMRQFAGAYRRVYNDALAAQQKNQGAGGKFVNYVGMAQWLSQPNSAQSVRIPTHVGAPLGNGTYTVSSIWKN